MPIVGPNTPVTAVAVDATEDTHALSANARGFKLANLGPNTVYLRFATGVTSANGYPIPSGSSESFGVNEGTTLYMICAATETADVRIAEER